ncbi:MAG: type 1 glutamine amidotransferase [Sedimentisphaerales bacterium]|nr:type 1 glutamine amidotransferase [Sedimentisphaerales bacterium]HNY76930.1 type 1 glutamine amidotransferase [Sedimentisphaerales bacterium]HOC62784.1 type 1 glutamine amidotransferase [Sedimentisphaerales bacterium]HOH62704.1 type 1 glutamine amidotransferase [Sedimentisphaerales bacterium]HPY49646.1 type 1 glutamine amidotransferase [Sedimentisphaerales bacterium]
MRLHWLGHVPFEDAANIGAWAEQHGCTVTSTQLYTGAPLPQIEEIDALAVMGGPMNVYQHRDHPWLLQEKRFLEQAIRAGIPTIGVCLGAQLVADVLGAKVVQNPHIEIGWFEVETVTESAGAEPNDHPPLPRDLPTRFMAFHWHGDTFEIPRGAIRIAQSRACRNQAFEYAGHVLGLQFHLEYSAESIEKMLAHCGHELVQAPFVQDRERITQGLANLSKDRELLDSVLNSLLGHVASNGAS